ncbi:MAG TPA: hypothetical protein VE994_06185 [Terriglobales bacterium]|nr:hypothetical protein [Terriglobales bacterium]
MPTWLTIAWTLGLLYGIVHGMLMLVSPAKHRKFNLLLNDPFRTIKLRIPESEDGRGLELGYRLGGLALMVGCTVMLLGSLQGAIVNHHSESLPKHPGTPTNDLGKDWWGLIAAAGFFLFGIYAFLQPQRVYQWGPRRALPSNLAMPTPDQIRRSGKILGICFVALGVILCVLLITNNYHIRNLENLLRQ